MPGMDVQYDICSTVLCTPRRLILSWRGCAIVAVEHQKQQNSKSFSFFRGALSRGKFVQLLSFEGLNDDRIRPVFHIIV